MDNLFKALLIIILLAFLYLYYENSNNDRFSYTSRVGGRVFDKKTGEVYKEYLGRPILDLYQQTILMGQ